MRHQFWTQAAVVAAYLGGVCAQLESLPPCGIACVNNVIAKGFGCASGDNTCLCKQQDFVFGIRDCAAQSCAADETTKVNDYVTSLCASTEFTLTNSMKSSLTCHNSCHQSTSRSNTSRFNITRIKPSAAFYTCCTANNTPNSPLVNFSTASTASEYCRPNSGQHS
ncbi:CFEM domain-containing protein [Colletotrichum tofieldiae]|nr:CFEM domain-containing protein [Colletotrichum tofieldiae]GKT68530.1 CFEM domain-containing protein [Colletotrichum tofieldiae]GKT90443.1 CFEM domain-containing protein [Colletotrichum tofieldiae]